MLLNVLGFGNGLLYVVGACASLVMTVYVYHVLLKPLLRGWFRKDTGLATMRIRHGREDGGGFSLEQRLNDSIAPPAPFDDEPAPDPFTVGGG